MICSFFTFIAPSHGNEAGQIAPPNEHAGKQLLVNETYHLVAIFLILDTNSGKDQVVSVLEDAVTKGQR